jgi:hypothetical protein
MEFKNTPPKKKVDLGLREPTIDVNHYSEEVAADWFKNDADWQDLYAANKKHKKKATKTQQKLAHIDEQLQKQPTENVQVNIKLTVPKVSKDGFVRIFRRAALSFKKAIIRNKNKMIVLLVLGCIFVIIFGFYKMLFATKSSKTAPKAATTQTQSQASGTNKLPVEKPKFKILYPGTKNSDSVGQIVRVSPPNNAPVYAYSDIIGGIKVNISQQELPQALKNQKALDDLAESNAQRDVAYADDGTKIYIGRSAKGVQSVTFTKGNLLIFMKSDSIISNDLWKSYVDALHT